ncbi:MAG TPA: DUF1643 domain-containing protein [Mesorhizobium sp.]|jgi:hypothetical protein|uniref:DUF1643 domain-containing protein n=1 Tax=Mesorhizobium sp. TaxID=1871066 RepID=UPI002DDD4671|nr:DUF1643 domain-containing protein [Mesorhizobium sp.]HEV2501456.1 DUF1643 domain-containing protein [Mesorhizobium sp.]
MSGGKYISAGATVSQDGKYRYRLWREWRLHPKPAQWSMWKDEAGKPMLDGKGAQLGDPMTCVFIMLNPSIADSERDDPTIRRCVAFAKAWGFDRLEVLNLFAYRATDPQELLALNDVDDPVGPENRHAFYVALDRGYPVGRIVCAWGAHGSHLGQDETALGWLEDRKRYALGLTKDAHPRHPLYVRADAPLVRFRP